MNRDYMPRQSRGVAPVADDDYTARHGRDPSRVVSYRVPHNTAVQVYDYTAQHARVVFGPSLVMLEPQESFTVLSLSGGTPKRPHEIRTILLNLGPEHMVDVVTVETSDHARLQLQLVCSYSCLSCSLYCSYLSPQSYNWNFKVDKTSAVEAGMLFSTPDFIGDACKTVASRVRAAVATTTFQEFHTSSSDNVKTSVFGSAIEGIDHCTHTLHSSLCAVITFTLWIPPHSSPLTSMGTAGATFLFSTNNLMITSVDIQSVEPVDQRTRESLSRSVQLAIEITTKSQEANAQQQAQRIEQRAKGELERQKIQDETDSEDEKKKLLVLQAESAVVESTGTSMAEAKARAEAMEIEVTAAVEQADLAAQALGNYIHHIRHHITTLIITLSYCC